MRPRILSNVDLPVPERPTMENCDFNQALDWTVEGTDRIGDLGGDRPARRNIRLGNHCYACTAGSGSSCGGATA